MLSADTYYMLVNKLCHYICRKRKFANDVNELHWNISVDDVLFRSTVQSRSLVRVHM